MHALCSRGYDSKHGWLHIAVDLPGHGDSPSSILPEPEKGGTSELVVALYQEIISKIEHQGELSTVVYGHSMGTRFAFEIAEKLQMSKMNTSHIILIDGSWLGATPPVLDMASLASHARAYRDTIQDRLGMYFGPRTSKEFESKVRAEFNELDYVYALRMGHYYGVFDTLLPALLDNIKVKVLAIVSQENEAGVRRSVKQGEVTAYMAFLRAHLSELTEHIVEGTGHYPHVDDIDEVTDVVVKFLDERNTSMLEV
ncbi:hypothetical protein ASPZODRAFT_136931 [Penicilliopsis zonata CBS 506.65]|uniref:AB hydrolase-1 domain-containing protein n=1 Tax=Penicilliopsis zonata CBS 506.65 TaxID=1073090 RepID=A0A1L9S6N5_9EURO|nr:hypothetical protein ASPZODRAFT_136931 [Penicilliopsis zonata CBS 506.65]OJJ42800.1 hypothetical protein ASPZODRAFT_136931 [Penicilliopsis zonata CBS 506.65]